jgi:hypothetical protein
VATQSEVLADIDHASRFRIPLETWYRIYIFQFLSDSVAGRGSTLGVFSEYS